MISSRKNPVLFPYSFCACSRFQHVMYASIGRHEIKKRKELRMLWWKGENGDGRWAKRSEHRMESPCSPEFDFHSIYFIFSFGSGWTGTPAASAYLLLRASGSISLEPTGSRRRNPEVQDSCLGWVLWVSRSCFFSLFSVCCACFVRKVKFSRSRLNDVDFGRRPLSLSFTVAGMECVSEKNRRIQSKWERYLTVMECWERPTPDDVMWSWKLCPSGNQFPFGAAQTKFSYLTGTLDSNTGERGKVRRVVEKSWPKNSIT